MYENAGRSIKSVVSIIVKIGYALSVLGGIVVIIGGLASGDIGILICTLFGAVVIGGLGCLSAWLSGLWLYAYGEITDRLISIDERLHYANLDGRVPSQSAPTPVPTPVAPAAPAAPVAPAAPAAPVAPAASAAPRSDVRFCPACGARNRADANYCVACAKKLS